MVYNTHNNVYLLHMKIKKENLVSVIFLFSFFPINQNDLNKTEWKATCKNGNIFVLDWDSPPQGSLRQGEIC